MTVIIVERRFEEDDSLSHSEMHWILKNIFMLSVKIRNFEWWRTETAEFINKENYNGGVQHLVVRQKREWSDQKKWRVYLPIVHMYYYIDNLFHKNYYYYDQMNWTINSTSCMYSFKRNSTTYLFNLANFIYMLDNRKISLWCGSCPLPNLTLVGYISNDFCET